MDKQAVQLVKLTHMEQFVGQSLQTPLELNFLSGQVDLHKLLSSARVESLQLKQVVDELTQVLHGEVHPIHFCNKKSI